MLFLLFVRDWISPWHTEFAKKTAYCNTLLHTATLAHTATHYNTLQRTTHTATRCKTLQHIATRCNTLQHAATHYNTLQHATTNCERMRFESQATNPTGSRALFPKGPTCIETSTFFNAREGIRGTGLFFWRDLSIEGAHESDRACWRLALTLTHTCVIHAGACPLLVGLNLSATFPIFTRILLPFQPRCPSLFCSSLSSFPPPRHRPYHTHARWKSGVAHWNSGVHSPSGEFWLHFGKHPQRWKMPCF